MKHRKFFILLSIAFLSITISTSAVEKNNISITKVDNSSISDIRVLPSLSTADTCIVRHDQGIVYKIGNWVQGNELYKSYLDPSKSCTNPYPYTITEIVMPMWFFSATSITISVDVENVNYANPNCPSPDTMMLGISSTWRYDIPDTTGIYNLWVPLDKPIVVTEPFFAGFFIGEISNPACSASVLTDNNSLSSCESYNVWDDSIGFVDLMDWGFPGQLVLYASGVPGGGSSEPAPQVQILSPSNKSNEYKTTEIWAHESSGSSIIDYISFAYATDSNYIEIGRDYDGTKSFRDSQNPSINGNGYSINWDFSSIPEGTYNFRVTAVDTLGRTASDTISLFLEPTPPIAEITTPSFGNAFCPPFNILMSSNDEDLTLVTLSYKRSDPNFSVHAQTLLLSNFGNYSSAALAASLAIQALADRGDTYLMREGSNALTPTQMATKMISIFDADADSVIYDENLLSGLQQFNKLVGNSLIIKHKRFPHYVDLRAEIELNGKIVLAGIGGTSNNWILIDGFFGTAAIDGSYLISISNPLNALIDTIQIREQSFGTEIFYNGDWQPIEIIISIGMYNWNNQMQSFGFDLNRSDGWSFNWTPPNLWQDNDYFIQSKGSDLTGLDGYNTTMLSYDCTQFYLAGDFNNDGTVDITDLAYLVNYFTSQGAPPIGGDARADTNCDGYLNITDIIYYANFIFGLAPTPCY